MDEIKTKLEELIDGRENQKTRRSESGSNSTGEDRGEGNNNGGGNSGTEGNPGGEDRGTEGENRGSQDGIGDAKTETKRRILSSLRSKGNQGHTDNANATVRNPEGELPGDDSRGSGDSTGNESNDRVASGKVERLIESRRKSRQSNSDLSGSDGNDSGSKSSRVEEKEKPKLGFSNLPKLEKPKDEKSTKATPFSLEPVLSKKEADGMNARLKEALKTLFKGLDSAIGMTTKNPGAKNVQIWSTIEDFEVEIIATALLENSMKSKVFATVTRRITRDFMKLQIGIITFPRFYQTYSHYMQNGFALGLPGGK